MIGNDKEAVCLVLCKSAKSQLKTYPERHWDSKHVMMKGNKVFSSIRILANLDSVFISSVRG